VSIGTTVLGCALLALQPNVIYAQDVVKDGRTNTTITVNGMITDVHTGTVAGGSGYNSLSRLNVSAGRTVNMHVPTGATRTINIVRGEPTNIAGQLRSMQNDVAGGGIVIANPQGIVVTGTGEVVAGSFTATTPTAEYLTDFFDAGGNPDAAKSAALLDGTAPQANVDVSILGTVRAGSARLQAGQDVVITGVVEADDRAAAIANVANLGTVNISAGRDVQVNGTLRASKADGAGGRQGGDIQISAGRDVTGTGLMSVSATSGNASAGTMILRADRDAHFTGVAMADGIGTGTGGLIDVEAKEALSFSPFYSAKRGTIATGAAGSIRFAERIMRIDMDLDLQGADITLEATQRFELAAGTQIKTRIDEFSTPYLSGPSGDIVIRAPSIILEEDAVLDARGGLSGPPSYNAYAGGTVLLEALANRTLRVLSADASAQIDLGLGVDIAGAEVTIRAEALASVNNTSVDEWLSLIPNVNDVFIAAGVTIGEVVQETVNPGGGTAPAASLSADARITSAARSIRAEAGDVTIEAVAQTDVDLSRSGDNGTIIALDTDTTARVDILESRIGTNVTSQQISGDRTNITARSVETHKIKVEDAEDGMASLILSDRSSSAIVAFGDGFGKRIPTARNLKVLAENLRDIDLEIAPLGRSFAAVSAIISRQTSEAIVGGNVSYLGSEPVQITARDRTVRDRAVAQSIVEGSPSVTGTPYLESVADLVFQSMEADAAGTTLSQDQLIAAATPIALGRVGLSGVVSSATQTTIASTSAVDLGGETIGGVALYAPLAILSGDAELHLTAETLIDALDIRALSAASGPDNTGVVLGHVHLDRNITTRALMENVQIQTGDAGAITVTARTVLPDGANPGIVGTGASNPSANIAGSLTLARLDSTTEAIIGRNASVRGEEDYSSYGGFFGPPPVFPSVEDQQARSEAEQVAALVDVGETGAALDDFLTSYLAPEAAAAIAELVRAQLGELPDPSATGDWGAAANALGMYDTPSLDGAPLTVAAETLGSLWASAGLAGENFGSIGLSLSSLRSTVNTRAAIEAAENPDFSLTSALPSIGSTALTITARDGTDLAGIGIAGASGVSGGPAGALVGVTSDGVTQAYIDTSRRVDAVGTTVSALTDGSVTLDAGTDGGAGVGAGVAYLDGDRSIFAGVGNLAVRDTPLAVDGAYMNLGTLDIAAKDARAVTLSADAGAGGGLREQLLHLGDVALMFEPEKVAELSDILSDVSASWSDGTEALEDRSEFIEVSDLPLVQTDLNGGLAAAAAVRNDVVTVTAGLAHEGRIDAVSADISALVTSVATFRAGSVAVEAGEEIAGMLAGAVGVDLGTRTVTALLQDVGLSARDALSVVAMVDDRTLIDAAAGGGVIEDDVKDLAGSVAADLADLSVDVLVRRSALWTAAPVAELRAEARGLTRLGAGTDTGAQPGEGLAAAVDLSDRSVNVTVDALGDTARGTLLRRAALSQTNYELKALDEGSAVARATAADSGGQELGGSVAVLAGTRDTGVSLAADATVAGLTALASSGTVRTASAGGEATGNSQRGAGQAVAGVYDRGVTAVTIGAGSDLQVSDLIAVDALRGGRLSATALSQVDITGSGLVSGNGAVALAMAGGTARVITDGVIDAEGLTLNATRSEEMTATATGALDSNQLIGLGLSVAALATHGDAELTLGGVITTGAQGLTAEAALDQTGTAQSTGGVAVNHGIGGGANLAGGVLLGQAKMALGFGAQIDTGQATARFTSIDRSTFAATTDRGASDAGRNLALSVAGFGGDRGALTSLPFSYVSGGLVAVESRSEATYSALAEGDPTLRVTLAGLGPAVIPQNFELVGAMAVTKSSALTEFDRTQITDTSVIRAHANAQIEGTATAIAQAEARVDVTDATFTAVNGIDLQSKARSAAVFGADGGVSLGELGGANSDATATEMIAEIVEYAEAAREVDIATRDIPNLPDISLALTGAAVEAVSDVQVTDSYIRSFNLLDVVADAETDLDLGRTADDLAVGIAASSTHSSVGITGGDLDADAATIAAVTHETQRVNATGSARPDVPGVALALSLRRASATVDLGQAQADGEGGYLLSEVNTLDIRAAIERDVALSALAQPDMRAPLAGAVALGYGEGQTRVTIGRTIESATQSDVTAETRNTLAADGFAWAREDRGVGSQADATPLARDVADTALLVADEMPVNRDGLDLDALIGAAGALDTSLAAGALSVAGMVLVDDTDVVFAPGGKLYAWGTGLSLQAENRMDDLHLRSGALTDGPETTGTAQTALAAALNLGAFDLGATITVPDFAVLRGDTVDLVAANRFAYDMPDSSTTFDEALAAVDAAMDAGTSISADSLGAALSGWGSDQFGAASHAASSGGRGAALNGTMYLLRLDEAALIDGIINVSDFSLTVDSSGALSALAGDAGGSHGLGAAAPSSLGLSTPVDGIGIGAAVAYVEETARVEVGKNAYSANNPTLTARVGMGLYLEGRLASASGAQSTSGGLALAAGQRDALVLIDPDHYPRLTGVAEDTSATILIGGVAQEASDQSIGVGAAIDLMNSSTRAIIGARNVDGLAVAAAPEGPNGEWQLVLNARSVPRRILLSSAGGSTTGQSGLFSINVDQAQSILGDTESIVRQIVEDDDDEDDNSDFWNETITRLALNIEGSTTGLGFAGAVTLSGAEISALAAGDDLVGGGRQMFALAAPDLLSVAGTRLSADRSAALAGAVAIDVATVKADVRGKLVEGGETKAYNGLVLDAQVASRRINVVDGAADAGGSGGRAVLGSVIYDKGDEFANVSLTGVTLEDGVAVETGDLTLNATSDGLRRGLAGADAEGTLIGAGGGFVTSEYRTDAVVEMTGTVRARSPSIDIKSERVEDNRFYSFSDGTAGLSNALTGGTGKATNQGDTRIRLSGLVLSEFSGPVTAVADASGLTEVVVEFSKGFQAGANVVLGSTSLSNKRTVGVHAVNVQLQGTDLIMTATDQVESLAETRLKAGGSIALSGGLGRAEVLDYGFLFAQADGSQLIDMGVVRLLAQSDKTVTAGLRVSDPSIGLSGGGAFTLIDMSDVQHAKIFGGSLSADEVALIASSEGDASLQSVVMALAPVFAGRGSVAEIIDGGETEAILGPDAEIGSLTITAREGAGADAPRSFDLSTFGAGASTLLGGGYASLGVTQTRRILAEAQGNVAGADDISLTAETDTDLRSSTLSLSANVLTVNVLLNETISDRDVVARVVGNSGLSGDVIVRARRADTVTAANGDRSFGLGGDVAVSVTTAVVEGATLASADIFGSLSSLTLDADHESRAFAENLGISAGALNVAAPVVTARVGAKNDNLSDPTMEGRIALDAAARAEADQKAEDVRAEKRAQLEAARKEDEDLPGDPLLERIVFAGTQAQLIADTQLDVTGAVTVDARSEARALAFAGRIGFSMIGLQGMFSTALMTEEVAADMLTGPSTVTVGEGLIVKASSGGTVTTSSVGIAASTLVSNGMFFAESIDTRRLRAAMTGREVQAGSVTVRADRDIDANAVGAGVVGSLNSAVGVGLARSKIEGEAAAAIDVGNLRSDSYVFVDANSTGPSVAVAVGAAAGSAVGVQMSLAISGRDDDVTATITDSVVDAGGAVALTAFHMQGDTDLGRTTAVAATIGGSGAVGVGASVALTRIAGTARAEAKNSVLQTNGNLFVEAATGGQTTQVAIGGGVGGSAGVGSSISVSLRTDETIARLDDTDVDIDGSAAVLATQQATISNEPGDGESLDATTRNYVNSIGVTAGISGTAGVGASLATTVVKSRVVAEILGDVTLDVGSGGSGVLTRAIDGTFSRHRGLLVRAGGDVSTVTTAITTGIGGVAGVAAQVNVVTIKDEILARIGEQGSDPQPKVVRAADVSVIGESINDHRTTSLTFGLGLASTGVGVGVTTLTMDRSIEALNYGDIDAVNVRVAATNDEGLFFGLLTGAGGFYAGVAGGIMVGTLETEVQAGLGGDIKAGRVKVEAVQDRYMWQSVVSGAGSAAAAVTGGLNTLYEEDMVRARIMSPLDTGSIAGRVDANTTEVLATRIADISLPTVTVSGGVAAVTGSITVFGSDVNVIADVNGPVDGRDLTVAATNSVNENGDALIVAPSLAGGLAAVGGTINVASLDHRVSARLNAPADVDLSGDLTLLATQRRNLKVQALTGSIGGTGISGLIATVAVGEIVEGLTDADILEAAFDQLETEEVGQIGVQDGNGQTSPRNLTSEATPELQEANAARAATIAQNRDRALGTSVAGVAADGTTATIGKLLFLDVAGDVIVKAQDDTLAEATAGAVNVGLLLGAGGTGITSAKVGSTTSADIQAGTRIYGAERIMVQALVGSQADPAQVRSTSGAASFTAGGALNIQSARAVSGRVVEATMGEELVINDPTGEIGAEVVVEAKLYQDVTADAVSTAGAVIGAGAVVSAFADSRDLVQTVWGQPLDNVSLPTAQGLREISSLTVRSLRHGTTRALADSTTVGLLAGGAATVATAKDRATVLSVVQRALVSDGDLFVTAGASGDVLAEAAGSTLALAGGQGSNAEAISDRNIQAVADSDDLSSGTIEVRAASGDQFNADRVQASVRAAQHGAVGGQGAVSNTDLGGTVQALLVSPDLDAGDVTVAATSHVDQLSEADSLGIRLLGGGGARAETLDDQTVTARIVANGRADTLALIAQTDRSTLADARAGAGALIGGAAARALDTVAANTNASLDSGGGILSVDGVLAVRRSASHTHGARADTTAVQAFGASGARANSDILASGGVQLDAGAQVQAHVFDLQADGQLVRDIGDADADVQAGDGSIASSSGAQATAVLSDTTRVEIGENARLTASSVNVSSSLGASSVLRGDLSARVVARGAIALPEAEATRVATQVSEVVIGTGAEVRSNGEMNLSALTESALSASSSADTRSLGASLRSDASNRLTSTGRIDVEGVVDAQGVLSAVAGGASHDVTAVANFFAGTPIELSRAPRSTAVADLVSRVDVAAGAELSAGRDMMLTAQPTSVVVVADGRGRNAFRALVADLVDAVLAVAERVTGTEFADVDLDIDPVRTETLTLDSRVQNAGLIQAGTRARLDITLGVDGTLSGPDGALTAAEIARLPIDYGTGSAVDLAEEILAERRAQEAELRSIGAIELADIIALEIQETEAVLQALSDRVDGPLDILRVGPVTLSGGNIEISADTVTGTGTLSAAADAGANIRVDRPDTLLLLDDIILPGTAGRIALGGSVVRTVDDLATLTGAQVFEGDIALDTAGVRAAASRPWTLAQVRQQSVLSTAIAAPELVASAVDDLATVGDISNLSGTVRLSSSQGSILQGGRIDARDLFINAPNGAVLVGFVPGVTHQGGNPDAIYEETLRFVEFAGLSSALTLPTRAPSLGAGIRAGSVSIYGDVVNVNGLVQAGVQSYSLTLPRELDYTVPFGMALGERVLLHDAVEGGSYGITGNVTVWAIGQGAGRPARLQLGDAATGGGRLRLAARAVVSTGNGKLSALDGYAGITIDSASTLVLETATLRTGEGQGRIEVIDTGVVVDASSDNPLQRYATTVWQSVDLGNGSRGYTRTENGVVTKTAARQLGADDSYTIRSTAAGSARLEWEVDRIWEIRNGIRTEPLVTPDGGDARRVGDMELVYSTEAANYVAATGGEFALAGDYTARLTRHSLSADSDIAIDFFGTSRADVSVSHMGAIDIGGAITAATGSVTLHTGPSRGTGEATRGIDRSITMQAAAPAIVAETVTLISRDGSGQPGTRTRIGAANAPIRIADTYGGAVTAIAEHGRTTQLAGGDIFLQGIGRLLVDAVSGGSLSLNAQDSIQGLPGRGYLYAADAATLVARAGSITGLSLRRVPGAVKAIAEGDIEFTHGAEQNFGALRLATVRSETGDVTITSSRAVLDANDNDRIDLETEAALIDAIWQRAGLTGADRDALIAQEVSAAEAQRRADHDWFWTVTAAIDAPYQADLAIQLSAAEIAALSADEAQALRRERTDAYHRGYALTGLGTATTPGAVPVGDGLGTIVGDEPVAGTFADETARNAYLAQQDAAFAGTLDAAGVAAITDQLTFASESLDLAARRSALLATADTTVEVEPANIQAAGRVTLRGASVGQDRTLARLTQESDPAYVQPSSGTTYSIAEGDEIPRDVLVALAQAARDDVSVARVVRADGSTATIITIQGVDDLDIEAGGAVVVEATGIDGSVNLGSEGGLTLASVVAPDRIRIASGGALVNSTLFGTTLSAGRISLEAGTGGIGTRADPMTFEGPSGDVGGRVQLDLRGASDIYLQRGSAAVRQTGAETVLGDAFTSAMLSVTSYDGSIAAADPQKVLIAGSLSLLSTDRIGDVLQPLRVALTGEKELRLEAATGDVRAEVLALSEADGIVTDGDVTVRRLEGRNIRLDVEGTVSLKGDQQFFFGPNFQPLGLRQVLPAISARGVAGDGSGDVTIFAASGVLDAGVDPDASVLIRDQVVDIEGGALRLIGGPVGQAGNTIETWVQQVSGRGDGGVHIYNRGDLSLGSLSAGTGAMSVRTASILSNQFNTQIEAGSALLRGIRVELDQDLTFTGTALTIDGGQEITQSATRTLRTFGNADLSLSALTANMDGTVSAAGALDIALTGSGSFAILGGNSVTLAARQETNIGPNGQVLNLPIATPVSVSADRITATTDISVAVAGHLEIGTLNAGRDLDVSSKDPALITTLDLGTVTAGNKATIRTDDLIGGGSLSIIAPRVVAELGVSDAAIVLSRRQAVLERLTSNNRVVVRGTDLTIEETFASDLTVKADQINVTGVARARNLTMQGLHGVEIAATGQAVASQTLLLDAGRLEEDFTTYTDASADLTIYDGGRAIGDLVQIYVADHATVTGIESTALNAGTVIALTAETMADGGDTYEDFVANRAGQITHLNAKTNMRGGQAFETQINRLMVETDHGILGIAEADTLIVGPMNARRGGLDIVAKGGQLLVDAGGFGVKADGRVILAAQGSVFTDGPQRFEMSELFVTSFEGDVGTAAQPFEIDSSSSIGRIAVAALNGISVQQDGFVGTAQHILAKDAPITWVNTSRSELTAETIAGTLDGATDGLDGPVEIGRFDTAPAEQIVARDLYPVLDIGKEGETDTPDTSGDTFVDFTPSPPPNADDAARRDGTASRPNFNLGGNGGGQTEDEDEDEEDEEKNDNGPFGGTDFGMNNFITFSAPSLFSNIGP